MEELYRLWKRRSSKMILLKKDIEDQIYDVVMATEIVGLRCVYPERKIVRKQQNKHGVVVGKTNWAVLATYSTFLIRCLQLVQQSLCSYVQCWRWCYNEGVSKALQYLLPFHATWGLSLSFLPLPHCHGDVLHYFIFTPFLEPVTLLRGHVLRSLFVSELSTFPPAGLSAAKIAECAPLNSLQW